MRWYFMAAIIGVLAAPGARAQVFTNFDPPGGEGTTFVNGIDNAGQVVGYFNDFENNGGLATGFLGTPGNPGSFTTFSDPNVTADGTFAQGISNNGLNIVGYYFGSGPRGVPSSLQTNVAPAFGNFGFLKTSQGFTTLSDPAAFVGDTFAMGVNDSGVVVGYFYDQQGIHGFTYNGGVYTTVNDPDAAAGSTFLLGINNNGTMVGGAQDSDFNSQAIIDDSGKFNTIAAVSGNQAAAYGISPDGNKIVGCYNDGSGNAFSLTDGINGTVTTLSDPNTPQGGLTCATGINASGVIAGYYGIEDSDPDGFIIAAAAAAVPEPATLAILGSGLLGLAIVRRRRLYRT